MTVYNAQDLTPDFIISQFLYGSSAPPANLESESLIRDAGAATSIQVDMASYFASAGRFAKASMSPLVQAFLTSDDPLLAGTGTKQNLSATDMAVILGLPEEFKFQQYSYDDAAQDRAARTLIYNTVTLSFSDETLFVIEADGTRRIANMSLVAENDNYDFASDSTAAQLFNPLVQAWTDPSGSISNGIVFGGLGRRVDIEYVNASNVPVIDNYTIANYTAESNYLSAHRYSVLNPYSDAALIGGVNVIAQNLFDNGVTRFLDDDERPILYGTNGGETVAALQVDSRAFIYDFLENGVQIFAGKGDDNLRGTTHQDYLHGGADKDILEGFVGDDTLAGDGGNDFLDGGAGQDIAAFLDVVGNVSIKKLTPNDIPAGFNPNGSAAFEFAFSRQGTGEADRLRDVEKIKFGDGEQKFLIEGEMKLGNANMLIDTGEGIDVVDFSKLTEGITASVVQIAGQEHVVSNQVGAAFHGVDVFIGTSVNDSIEGGEGAQSLFGGDGDDVLRGGAGDDVLEGGSGRNIIETGAGNDRIIFQSNDTVVDGDAGDRLFIRLSTITGDPSQESTLIPILGGLFLISPFGELETFDFSNMDEFPAVFTPQLLSLSDDGISVEPLYPQLGPDFHLAFWRNGTTLIVEVYTQPGFDPAFLVFVENYQPGDFGLTFNTVFNPMESDGVEHVFYEHIEAYTQAQQALLNNGSFSELPSENDYHATEVTADGSPAQLGTSNPDQIPGSTSDDLIYAGGGNDQVSGGDGKDNLYGQDGDDELDGGEGDDFISGGNGSDTLDGGAGDDRLLGGAGDDAISGSDGSDTIVGNSGDDSVDGGDGGDIISGDAGFDGLHGGEGNDALAGGAGDDVLEGGAGSDTFVFAVGDWEDTVVDFTPGEDILEFRGGAFADAAAAFAAATSSGDDTIIVIDEETSVILQGVALANLSVNDFHVV